MSATLLFAAALAPFLAAAAPGTAASEQGSAYAAQEMVHNQTQAAIARMLASGMVEERDPATLINLGAAYARLGQKKRALAMYHAAIASPDRYDLQLADGRWMDSRAAARMAATALEKDDTFVMR